MLLPNFETWKDFLLRNPDRLAYDEKADCIQNLIDIEESAVNNFRLLSENKALVCISKSQMGKNLQLTFYHSIKKPAILSTESEYFALTGFSSRASAVRLDPKDLFKLSTKKFNFPSFEQLMLIKSEEDIKQLAPTNTMDDGKLEHHALLPPLLFEELLDLEDLRPHSVLLSILNRIRSLKDERSSPAKPQISSANKPKN